MVPEFDDNGNLPPGIHWVSWSDFCDRFGQTSYRMNLISGLHKALICLKNAGCKTIYIDGSFVTSKSIPGDYDCCWDIMDVDAKLIDPVLLIFDNQRTIQKAKYYGEFFPAQIPEGRTGLLWINFFQIDKNTGGNKGIIAIDLRSEKL